MKKYTVSIVSIKPITWNEADDLYLVDVEASDENEAAEAAMNKLMNGFRRIDKKIEYKVFGVNAA